MAEQEHPYNMVYGIPLGLRLRWVELADNEFLVARHIADYSLELLDDRENEIRLLQTAEAWKDR